MSNRRLSRRDFMRGTAAAAGATLASKTILLDPGPAYAADAAVPPSDTLRLGIIGIGMQGNGLLRGAITRRASSAWRPATCTTAGTTLAREIVGKPIPVTRRYQDLLDNKEIDCIINATPDHWHKQIVVDCCNAGKDVYSEKPMTHGVSEGFEMIAAAQKNNRIVQIGSQRASSIMFAKAKELIAQGAIGDVHTVEGCHGPQLSQRRVGISASAGPLAAESGLGHLARHHPQDSLQPRALCALALLAGLWVGRGGRPDGSPADRHPLCPAESCSLPSGPWPPAGFSASRMAATFPTFTTCFTTTRNSR